MRVLHLVKTSDGARWAAEQARELHSLGVDVAVVLPSSSGKMIQAWRGSGAKLYFANIELPIKSPWEFGERKRKLLEIVEDFSPDLVHSHFFSTTVLARGALGKRELPIAFQVPGPLHLENSFFKKWDITSARPQDFWIASSLAIRKLYLSAGISPQRVGASYYGNRLADYQIEALDMRSELGLRAQEFLVGSVSYFYPPKRYLFQKEGLKGHEFLFKCLSKMPDVKGAFWGAQWGEGDWYERKLRRLAPKNVKLPGPLAPFNVSKAWRTIDLCVHAPLSENCGGVVEPLLHGAPVLAADIGGIGEIIINGKTGILCERDETAFKEAIEFAKKGPQELSACAKRGQDLVKKTFDVQRTSKEIFDIYMNGVEAANKRLFIPREHVKDE